MKECRVSSVILSVIPVVCGVTSITSSPANIVQQILHSRLDALRIMTFHGAAPALRVRTKRELKEGEDGTVERYLGLLVIVQRWLLE